MGVVAPLLPIFPLDTVLLPGAPMPLHIFEPRYRALVADVWSDRDGRPEQPGFGIVSIGHRAGGGEVRGPGRLQRPNADTDPAGEDLPLDQVGEPSPTSALDDLALVGTFASILEVEPYSDGRSDVLTVGERRFRLLELVPNGKPYLQARVEWLPEELGVVSEALAEAARSRCARYLAVLARLADRELPEVKFATDPIALSYQVAGRMRLANRERQGLLEAATASDRLRAAAAITTARDRAAQPHPQRARLARVAAGRVPPQLTTQAVPRSGRLRSTGQDRRD